MGRRKNASDPDPEGQNCKPDSVNITTTPVKVPRRSKREQKQNSSVDVSHSNEKLSIESQTPTPVMDSMDSDVDQKPSKKPSAPKRRRVPKLPSGVTFKDDPVGIKKNVVPKSSPKSFAKGRKLPQLPTDTKNRNTEEATSLDSKFNDVVASNGRTLAQLPKNRKSFGKGVTKTSSAGKTAKRQRHWTRKHFYRLAKAGRKLLTKAPHCCITAISYKYKVAGRIYRMAMYSEEDGAKKMKLYREEIPRSAKVDQGEQPKKKPRKVLVRISPTCQVGKQEDSAVEQCGQNKGEPGHPVTDEIDAVSEHGKIRPGTSVGKYPNTVTGSSIKKNGRSPRQRRRIKPAPKDEHASTEDSNLNETTENSMSDSQSVKISGSPKSHKTTPKGPIQKPHFEAGEQEIVTEEETDPDKTTLVAISQKGKNSRSPRQIRREKSKILEADQTQQLPTGMIKGESATKEAAAPTETTLSGDRPKAVAKSPPQLLRSPRQRRHKTSETIILPVDQIQQPMTETDKRQKGKTEVTKPKLDRDHRKVKAESSVKKPRKSAAMVVSEDQISSKETTKQEGVIKDGSESMETNPRHRRHNPSKTVIRTEDQMQHQPTEACKARNVAEGSDTSLGLGLPKAKETKTGSKKRKFRAPKISGFFRHTNSHHSLEDRTKDKAVKTVRRFNGRTRMVKINQDSHERQWGEKALNKQDKELERQEVIVPAPSSSIAVLSEIEKDLPDIPHSQIAGEQKDNGTREQPSKKDLKALKKKEQKEAKAREKKQKKERRKQDSKTPTTSSVTDVRSEISVHKQAQDSSDAVQLDKEPEHETSEQLSNKDLKALKKKERKEAKARKRKDNQEVKKQDPELPSSVPDALCAQDNEAVNEDEKLEHETNKRLSKKEVKALKREEKKAAKAREKREKKDLKEEDSKTAIPPSTTDALSEISVDIEAQERHDTINMHVDKDQERETQEQPSKKELKALKKKEKKEDKARKRKEKKERKKQESVTPTPSSVTDDLSKTPIEKQAQDSNDIVNEDKELGHETQDHLSKKETKAQKKKEKKQVKARNKEEKKELRKLESKSPVPSPVIEALSETSADNPETKQKVKADTPETKQKVKADNPESKQKVKAGKKIKAVFRSLTHSKIKTTDQEHAEEHKKYKKGSKKQTTQDSGSSQEELEGAVTTETQPELESSDKRPSLSDNGQGRHTPNISKATKMRDKLRSRTRISSHVQIGEEEQLESAQGKKSSKPKVVTYKRNAVTDAYFSIQHQLDRLAGKLRRNRIDLRNKWRDFKAEKANKKK